MNRLSSLRRPALTPAILAVASAMLLAAGCSSGGKTEESGEPEVSATPRITDPNSFAFPLDPYLTKPDDQLTLSKAQAELTRQCMKRFGFTYRPTPQRPTVNPFGENGLRYGVSSMQLAAKYGYGSGSGNGPDQSEAPASGAELLTGAAKLAMFGKEELKPSDLPSSQEEAEASEANNGVIAGKAVPVGGCQREAAMKVFSPRRKSLPVTFTYGLTTDAWSRTRHDSRYVAVGRKWAECLKEKGYVTSPDPLTQDRDLKFPDPQSPQAITVAKADVACKEKVNLIGVAFAVESAYQKRLVEQNAEALKQVQRQQEEQLRLAASLLR
ncbi:hypothetical protein [Streptomyces sp. SID9727]|uniref:hypothetical protein n=1 Tax=Streptomyces sp. SID9727 TaxID=2706114 RepID=UPI0013CBDB98|nr:hypothetical protein [Streptomyces sp. SID9727]NEC69912.1 hypothetical protein [Streptomyces sp. SID9727]